MVRGAPIDRPREFLLNNQGIEFATGRASNGEQVLMGLYLGFQKECVRTFFFDNNGSLLRLDKRMLLIPEVSGMLSMGNDLVRDRVLDVMNEWKKELGFCAGAITVQPFLEDRVGIASLPSDYQSFLDGDHELLSDESKAELLELIAKWYETGMFVLWWGKEYWMNGDGTVHSS